MVKKLYILFTLLLCATANLQAQDIKFETTAPSVVRQGERFQLRYNTNSKGTDLVLPDFSGFSVLMGPSVSSSTSVQIINGKTTQSSNYSYTYILLAMEEGKHTIPPASITIKGKKYQTNTFTIEVIGDASATTATTSTKSSASNKSTSTKNNASADLFLKLEPSKRNPYVGESLTTTLKLYTRVNIVQVGNFRPSTYNGFLSQEIAAAKELSYQRENIDGQIYEVAILKQDLLFPQKTGKIDIASSSLDCVVREKTTSGRNDPFDMFFGNYNDTKKLLKSQPLTINVKALPQEGKPNNFSGAVGNFSITASIDQEQVKTNDAITLKIKIQGNGNLKLIDPLDVEFHPSFEVYEPKISTSIKNTETGAVGSKTIEYVIIPRDAGEFEIPAVAFSYFNPKSRQYKTLKTQIFNIAVEKGEGGSAVATVTGIRKEDLKFLGKDIRYIKTHKVKLQPKDNLLLNKTGFYLSYLIAFLVFIILFFILRKQQKEHQNITLLKNKKANKIAKKRLKTSSMYLKQQNKKAFYGELLRAMWGYLSDKLSIPTASLNKENITETLKVHSVPKETIDSFIEILNTSEYAQFSPTAEAGEMDKLYKDTISIISKLENQIKRVKK